MEYQQVQNIAKETMRWIRTEVKAGMTLLEVRARCEEHLMALGADSFWYYDVGAFVFCGEQTALSASGRTYSTPECVLQADDILTIDLSPQRDGVWGDYARTIILQDGTAVETPDAIRNSEWKSGLQMEEMLHNELFRTANPAMSFEQLYDHMNRFIKENGYINLDFNGNLGHSIVRDKNDRVYIEKGNCQKLGDVNFFTFEPHIGTAGLPYGYKKENIYYFDNSVLKEL